MAQHSIIDAQTGQKKEIFTDDAPGGGGAALRVGFDQPIELITLAEQLALSPFLRDNSANPLDVNMGAVVAGQVLEINFTGTFGVDDPLINPSTVFLAGLVTFVAAPVFPDDFFQIVDASTSMQQEAGTLSSFFQHAAFNAAFAVPANSAACRLRVGFTNSEGAGGWVYGAAAVGKVVGASVTLKGTLWDPAGVAQLGPGQLLSLA